MRLAHLADLHLGFRQYQRSTPSGINQREADVEAQATRVFSRVAALRPELVVICGDIFHTVRPSNPAILHAYRLFADLRDRLPDTEVVMVAGNHDAPRTQETGCILGLFRELGVHVADRNTERFHFPAKDLSVLAVPDVYGIRRPPLTPDPGCRYNVLALHGQIAGMQPAYRPGPERAALEITPAELHADEWSYVALGHYHVYSRVHDRAYYSGSIEYTSTNPWGELQEEKWKGIRGKGFVEHDLATHEHRFHPVPLSRRLLDLESIDAAGLTAAEVDAAIRQRIGETSGGIDDNIVRLTVSGIPRHIARELDHAAIREYRRRAVSFHLNLRQPDPLRRKTGEAAPGRRATLPDIVKDRLTNRVLTPGVDRQQFVASGMRYFAQADEQLTAAVTLVEE